MTQSVNQSDNRTTTFTGVSKQFNVRIPLEWVPLIEASTNNIAAYLRNLVKKDLMIRGLISSLQSLSPELDQLNIDTTLLHAARLFPDSQMEIAVEELSELITAIQHFKRQRCDRTEILEEVCDVKIITRQLEIIFGYTEEEIRNQIKVKILRLQRRIAIDRMIFE